MAERNWHPLFDATPPARRFAIESSPQSRRRGVCLTIASQKGGVGKTTTAVNLAAGVGLAGRKVALVDFDPQANATSGVGEEKVSRSRKAARRQKGSDEYEFLASLDEPTRFLASLKETEFENLWLSPSFEDLSSLDMIQRFVNTYLDQWKATVEFLRSKFDLILVDCPPSLGGLPTLALSVSDGVIIPVQCEYYAMEGLSQILPVVEEVRSTRNADLQIAGLLLTMYSHELELARDVSREIREYFPETVYESVIPRDVTLAESASHGLPVLYYNFESRGAWSYMNLTREVLEHEGA